MADRVRLVCAVDGRPADVGLATTGVAGPDWQDGRPPGTVYVAVASARGIRSVRLALDGDRPAVRRAAVAAVISAAMAELEASPARCGITFVNTLLQVSSSHESHSVPR